jgi:glycosyltransferase involved in cell wall biosynthesis
MRVGLIASPFISVPPAAYGGTELFIANLAEALGRLGTEVIVYTNGESQVNAPKRWLYPRHEWPLPNETAGLTKEAEHTAWAIEDAENSCDIIHISSALAVPFARFSKRPFVCTLHHPADPRLTEIYQRCSSIAYVAISHHQAERQSLVEPTVIHHGLDMSRYCFRERKEPYAAFLGRICPIKGVHNAIAIAKDAGVPLKIAGEVQPIFREYFEKEIVPHIDGEMIEYVGEADFALKNELLSKASALLFPIEWEEPFGLVMIEAMACGTPVIAFPGGAVNEVVEDGITGSLCNNPSEAARALCCAGFHPGLIRRRAEARFSAVVMAQQYLHLYRSLLDGALPLMMDPEEETAA